MKMAKKTLGNSVICMLLATINMFFWIPFAFDLIPHSNSAAELMVGNPLMNISFKILAYGPGKSLFFVPLFIAFLFGIYNKRDGYKLAGLAGFCGAIGFAYISAMDTEYGVEGGFSEDGSLFFLVTFAITITVAVTLLAYAGGKIRDSFDGG